VKTYETAEALRVALEHRLLAHSRASGVNLERLRRRVVFERVVARLHHREPSVWVIKGGMALEMRLCDDARLTKDLDLGLRAPVGAEGDLRERLIESLAEDPDLDRFVLVPGAVTKLLEQDDGAATWRTTVTARLAGRPFGTLQLDISPRPHELGATDRLPLPNSLAFAGIETPTVEVVAITRHAAEKFHGMLMQFEDRENSRVRDLVDLVILEERKLLDPYDVAVAVRQVWAERAAAPPVSLPALPAQWPERYERLAHEYQLRHARFDDAVTLIENLWTTMFPTGEA
jgi:hypothetical protein